MCTNLENFFVSYKSTLNVGKCRSVNFPPPIGTSNLLCKNQIPKTKVYNVLSFEQNQEIGKIACRQFAKTGNTAKMTSRNIARKNSIG